MEHAFSKKKKNKPNQNHPLAFIHNTQHGVQTVKLYFRKRELP